MDLLKQKQSYCIFLFVIFILIFLHYHVDAQDIYINELMASNHSVLSDGDGDYDDWLEIYNSSNHPVDLAGYYLSDDPKDIKRWQFPQNNKVIIQPEEYLVIWADNDTNEGPLHTNFKLSANGETLILTAPEGNREIDRVSFSVQKEDVSFGRKNNNISRWSFFIKPTPGTTNNTIAISSLKIIESIKYISKNIIFVLSVLIFFLGLLIISILLFISRRKIKYSKLQLKKQNEKQKLQEKALIKQRNSLERVNQKLKNIFDYGNIVFLSMDMKEYRLIDISGSVEKLYGYTCKEFLEDPSLIYNIVHPEDKERIKTEKDKLRTKDLQDIIELDYRIIHSEDKINWLNEITIPIRNNKNELIRFDSLIFDITQRKYTRDELKQTSKQLETIFDNIQICIFLVDVDKNKQFKFARINSNLEEATGLNNEEIKEKTSIKVFGDKVGKEIEANYRKCLKSKETIVYEEELALPGGNKTWLTKLSPVIIEGEVVQIVGTSLDITSRKKSEERIKYLSFHDELTDLYNRRYFENEIERLNGSRILPISIVVGDIDNLKFINDNYRHKMGDKYIKEAGRIINIATRQEDIVARIGGDEYAVILPETNAKTAQELCERIYSECNHFNKNNKLPEPLIISLGYATMNRKAENLNDIFDKADQQMYKNKNCRNHINGKE